MARRIVSHSNWLDNEKTENLDQAYDLFLDTLDEYSKKKNLPAEVKEAIKGEVSKAYQEKKASYWLESRVAGFANYITRSLAAFSSDEETEGDTTSVLYYKDKSRLIKHEQHT